MSRWEIVPSGVMVREMVGAVVAKAGGSGNGSGLRRIVVLLVVGDDGETMGLGDLGEHRCGDGDSDKGVEVSVQKVRLSAEGFVEYN